MALGSLAGRTPARTVIRGFTLPAITGLRPTRILLDLLIGAFVLAMLYVLQIQSLVVAGSEIRDLEYNLEIELRRQESLRAELAALHNVDEIERRARFDFDLQEPATVRVIEAPKLPPAMDLSPPPWFAVPAPERLSWVERLVSGIRDKIDLLKLP